MQSMIGRIFLAVAVAVLAVGLAPREVGAQGGGCAPPAAGALKIDGVIAQVDEITYVAPRSAVRLEAGGEGASWFLNGVPANAATLPSPWTAGPQDLLITAFDGCGQPARVAETHFVVDAAAPQLSWKVVDGRTLEGKVPDQGRDKRYLWWWFQPEKRRLVWSDGESAWNVLRQYPDTRVNTSPTRSTIYVWAPDENPFDDREGEDVRLRPDRILVLEATDDSSGVAGLQVRFVAESGGSADTGREVDQILKLVVSAVDRVGNSTEVELPYRTRE
jgi:hypothetical protein